MAVLNANYIAKRLAPHFPVLYTGANGLVAHECIIDLRPLTKETGVTVDDVAKRLIDYGFHAPTMSFPVAGHADGRADGVRGPRRDRPLLRGDDRRSARRSSGSQAGEWPKDDNPLANAPHTAQMLVGDWSHPYSRELACYPVRGLCGRQVLAAGAPHRRRLRRPQPDDVVPAPGSLRGVE